MNLYENDFGSIRYCIRCGMQFAAGVDDAVICPECFLFDTWSPGNTIASLYDIKEVITSGGMGLVYKVFHRDWKINLAVKSPRPDITKRAGGLENFIKEAETWVYLGLHSHIVTCYYVRTLDDGIPRVFAEWVDGGSLSQWIKEGKLYEEDQEAALERILDIAIQFAWGLNYAHLQGLVHQDVKPANLLISNEGLARVTDFGLARAQAVTEDEEGWSRAGVSMQGMTREYASPEQLAAFYARAETGEQLIRLGLGTDIWSWAVSVLEMFIGERTWSSGSIADVILKQYLETGPVRRKVPAMPAGMAKILERCFKADPRERFTSMGEIAKQLQEIYRQETGKDYHRKEPRAIDLKADSLNNHAVSLMDLGQEEEAFHCWEEALRENPLHLETVINFGYHRWQRGDCDDIEYLGEVRRLQNEHAGRHEYWMALAAIHCVRGDEKEWKLIKAKTDRVKQFPDFGGPRFRLIRNYDTDGEIVNIAISEDEKVIGVCGRNGKIYILGSCLEPLQILKEPFAESRVLAFYPYNYQQGERYLVTGSMSNELHVWELNQGQLIQVIRDESHWSSSLRMSVLAIFPSARHLLSSCFDIFPHQDKQPLVIWDVLEGKKIGELGYHQYSVYCGVIFPDGRRVASGGADGLVKIWNVASKECSLILLGHQGPVYSLCLLPGGNSILVTGGADGTIRLWDCTSGDCRRVIKAHREGVNTLAAFPDGIHLASGGADGNIKVWDLDHGICLRTLEGDAGNVASLAIYPGGNFLVSGGQDGKLYCWEIVFSRNHNRFPLLIAKARDASQALMAREERDYFLAQADEYMSKGRYSVAYKVLNQARSNPEFENDNSILDRIYACSRCGHRVSLKKTWAVHKFTNDSGKRAYTAVFSPNGKIVTASSDGSIRVWDGGSEKTVQLFPGHKTRITALQFLPHGPLLSSSRPENLNQKDRDRTLRLWQLDAESCISTFNNHQQGISSLAVSPDKKLLAAAAWEVMPAAGDYVLHLWNLPDCQKHNILSGHRDLINTICFTNDGRFLVSGAQDGEIRIWEAASACCVSVFPARTAVRTLAAIPGGWQVISGSNDRLLRIWDLNLGQCLESLSGHKGAVSALTVFKDGCFAVSGDEKGEIRFWDLEEGCCTAALSAHSDGVTSLSLSNDERCLLSSSYDGDVIMWEMDWEWEFDH